MPSACASATTSRTMACCSSRISGCAARLRIRRLRERRDRVVGAVDQQLGPQLGHHVGRDRHLHAGRRRTARPGPAARGDARHRASRRAFSAPMTRSPRPKCLTMPGTGHRGGDVDDRGHDGLAHVARDGRRVFHAVLQAEDDGVRLQQRRQFARDRVGVGRLDAEQDQVRAAHGGQLGAGLRAQRLDLTRHVELAARRARMASTCGGRPIRTTRWPARASIAP